ncbi:hypothetical protein PT2222_260014 [Paraburkholderia tropica]
MSDAIRSTSSRVSRDTPGRPLSARDAVICDTPASLATSASVGFCLVMRLACYERVRRRDTNRNWAGLGNASVTVEMILAEPRSPTLQARTGRAASVVRKRRSTIARGVVRGLTLSGEPVTL